jgi:hypothetical protein
MKKIINWKSDSLNVIRAKQAYNGFIDEINELRGRSTNKIDAYHKKRIKELENIIKQTN